jgi:predicted ATPase/DNA-binding XRE family transcriptional regulator
MKAGATGSFGAHLRQLREAAGFTQEELATIAGLSVAAVSALERGQRRRPHVETVRALSAALDLSGATRTALIGSARPPTHDAAVDELSRAPLPLALTRLLGRDAETHTLRSWFADSQARLITLTGPGGSGKTRLALELARAIASDGVTRVVFVPLAAISNPSLVGSEVASALGLSDLRALDLPRRARVGCGDRPTLLVLDNFEQVLDAAALVVDLLASVETLRVLATSRSPLRVRGEREFAVGPLSLEPQPDSVAPAEPAQPPAVRLFLERVRDVKPDFRLTSANSAIVTAICRRLDALPLALELAAPWMKVLTAEDLFRRLEQGVLLSSAGPRDLPERQQTINATVGWSYQLLRSDEQRLFRRLGVLPARFSIEAAEAVIEDREAPSPPGGVLGAIAGLIDRSLLQRADTSVANRPMYQMLETVRAYARLELDAAGERDAALERTARYCAREASKAADGLVAPTQVEWLNRVRDELEIYRGALAWLIERRRSEEACDIAWKLKYFWMIRGHAAEGIRWYEQILSLPSIPPVAESRAIVGTAVMWFTQGELVRARIGLDRAMALAEATADKEMVSQVDNLLGHVERADGHLDLARNRFDRSIAAFQALAYPSGIGNALTGMAVIALAAGDASCAERLLDDATSVLRQAGPWFLAWTLYVRAVLAVQREDPDSAIRWVRESLTHVRELHDRFVFVYSLVPLAAAAVLKGDDAWAARILGARDAVTERTGVTAVDRSVHELRERAEREVRARLGADRWTRAYAAGRSTSVDSLLKDIDAVLQKRQVPR